jgi:hypothetical protein
MASTLGPALIESLKSNPKERLDMILEPLQVMIQLASLGFCPRGTKISISENILSLQRPAWSQGVWRWYGRDSKEDLYYLFHAIRRYYIWYKDEDEEIYDYILEKAKNGIKKLIETYENTEKTSLIHTLSLYKNILDLESPDLFKTDDDTTINLDQVFQTIIAIYNKKILLIVISTLKLIEEEKDELHRNEYYEGLQKILAPTNARIRAWIREKLTC